MFIPSIIFTIFIMILDKLNLNLKFTYKNILKNLIYLKNESFNYLKQNLNYLKELNFKLKFFKL